MFNTHVLLSGWSNLSLLLCIWCNNYALNRSLTKKWDFTFSSWISSVDCGESVFDTLYLLSINEERHFTLMISLETTADIVFHAGA